MKTLTHLLFSIGLIAGLLHADDYVPPTNVTVDGVTGYWHMNTDKDGKQSRGGFVADTARVSPEAFIGPHAKIFGNAKVSSDARVYDRAIVRGNAQITDYCRVYGASIVEGDAIIGGFAQIGSHALITGNAFVGGHAIVGKNSFLNMEQVMNGRYDDEDKSAARIAYEKEQAAKTKK